MSEYLIKLKFGHFLKFGLLAKWGLIVVFVRTDLSVCREGLRYDFVSVKWSSRWDASVSAIKVIIRDFWHTDKSVRTNSTINPHLAKSPNFNKSQNFRFFPILDWVWKILDKSPKIPELSDKSPFRLIELQFIPKISDLIYPNFINSPNNFQLIYVLYHF